MAQFDIDTTGREVVQAFSAHAVGKTSAVIFKPQPID